MLFLDATQQIADVAFVRPAEDDPVMQKVTSHTLLRLGYRPTVVSNGAQGVMAARGKPYDVILMDIMMPVMGHTTLESIRLLSNSTTTFVDFCLINMEPNIEGCETAVEKSLSMCTSLNPHVGYEKAAGLAKEAFKTGKTIRELCMDQEILPAEVLADVLDPMKMTEPRP